MDLKNYNEKKKKFGGLTRLKNKRRIILWKISLKHLNTHIP